MSHTILVVLFALATGLVFGKFAMPVDAPVARLTQNIEAYIKAHPTESSGHYTLARLHYMAFALRSDKVGHYEQELPKLGDPFHPGKPGEREGKKITEEEALHHLIKAATGIQTAIEMDPGNALYALTSACIKDDGAVFAPQVKAGDTAAGWKESAIAEYKRAYELAWKQDSKLTRQPLSGLQSLVSYEAGDSYIKMVEERGALPGEKKTVEKIRAHLKHLNAMPITGITPIVLSLTPQASLDALLDPHVQSTFDLDGTCRPQRYPWLSPTTGLLVWDPKHTGSITSGRQLFGSVTWWMFWDSGYDALAALDDNHDGWLTGNELEGLAVWFDRNQDGRSDPGEVIPIAQLGIDAINVRADGSDGLSWKSGRGIRLRDGSYLPTWDWIAQPIPSPQAEWTATH